MKPPDIDSEARIDELEVRLAQQDHSILELSDEVYQQQKLVARLEIEVRHLTERLQRIEPRESLKNSTDETPPHY